MSTNILEINDLSISFGGIRAVQNFSFNVEKGEILGLIGPNGCGKSTTVNLISGLYAPENGTITFNGTKLIKKHSVAQRSKMGMGRTFQTPKPFGNMTVYNNVFSISLLRYGFKEATKKTEDILDMFGLSKMRDDASSGLPIEKRKWLDLARVMATEPSLVMMDEVMAGLTPNEMQESLEIVREVNKKGVTVLFIEHVMRAVVSVCTRAIVMNEGKFLFEGSPEDALNDQSVIEAYIGGHKGGEEDA